MKATRRDYARAAPSARRMQAPPDKTPGGWSDVARAYDDIITPRFAPYSVAALDAVGLRPGERVLDVAAGTGALALEAARQGAHVVATDFASGMVARLAERAVAHKLDVEALEMDAQELRFPDASFDVVGCAFGVMFFEDRVKALREMRRVLRPAGRLALLTWGAPEHSGFFRLFAQALARAVPDMPEGDGPPTPFTMGEPSLVRAPLEQAGFSRIEVRAIRHAMDLGPPERAWNDMISTNPVIPALLARLPADAAPKVRAALEEVYRENEREGHVVTQAEAMLATATR